MIMIDSSGVDDDSDTAECYWLFMVIMTRMWWFMFVMI